MAARNNRLGIWLVCISACWLEAAAAGAARSPEQGPGWPDGAAAWRGGSGAALAVRGTVTPGAPGDGQSKPGAGPAGAAGSTGARGADGKPAGPTGQDGDGGSDGRQSAAAALGSGALVILAIAVHLASLCLLGRSSFRTESAWTLPPASAEPARDGDAPVAPAPRLLGAHEPIGAAAAAGHRLAY